MSSIVVPNNDLTPFIDMEETFGKFLFINQIRDEEERGEDGERGEVTAIRCELLSVAQGFEFRVKVNLSDNPYASFEGLKFNDEVELVNPRVFERNIPNNSYPNVVVTIEADDVRKVEKQSSPKPQVEVSQSKEQDQLKKDQKK
ncbi:hypothetical protein CUS80_00275 [Enterococcus faecium]|uniref:DUF961 family protein n=1 Tax=Enterococcus faecium TaxID=1352 RepID=UPI000CF33B41|nr:DUF961 family protein [Enterococcus faecium]PQG48408.1 hypothetical protein CUS80_00275 [Enterococcus faecium]